MRTQTGVGVLYRRRWTWLKTILIQFTLRSCQDDIFKEHWRLNHGCLNVRSLMPREPGKCLFSLIITVCMSVCCVCVCVCIFVAFLLAEVTFLTLFSLCWFPSCFLYFCCLFSPADCACICPWIFCVLFEHKAISYV